MFYRLSECNKAFSYLILLQPLSEMRPSVNRALYSETDIQYQIELTISVSSPSHYPGLNQLLWYYADMEKKKCLEDAHERQSTLDGLMHGRRGNKAGDSFVSIIN